MADVRSLHLMVTRSVGLDPLSALFLLPLLVLAALAGFAALPRSRARPPAPRFGLFGLLVAAMVLVVTARHALLFLVAWEAAVLSVCLLARRGLAQIAASHASTLVLLVFFLLQGRQAGSFAFADLAGSPHERSWLLLALAGFGAAIAWVPLELRVSAAKGGLPDPVAALVAGVMGKLGFYGLVRMVLLLGPPPPAFTWILLLAGSLALVAGGIATFVTTSPKGELRRLLAATNLVGAGFLATALGVTFLGRAGEANAIAVLAFCALLLHVAGDAVVQMLLFLGVGAVEQTVPAERNDPLRGLFQRLPRTGLFLVIGVAALLGLPPLCGFASAVLLVVGAFEGATTQPVATAAPLFGVLAVMVLTLALGITSCIRVVRRTSPIVRHEPATSELQDPSATTLAPLLLLALLCLAGGLAAPLLVRALRPIVAQFFGDPSLWSYCHGHAERVVAAAVGGGLALVLLGGGGVAVWRRLRPRGPARAG